MKNLSIVVPIYNEEAVLPAFYQRLHTVLNSLQMTSEIVFVNDGSRDHSLDILLQLREIDPTLRIVDFSRNFGHQTAITAGLDFSQGEASIVMDGDLQHPPEIIPELIKLWQQGALIVTPIKEERAGEGFFKRSTAKLFYRFIRRIADVDIVSDASDFRLLDRRVVDQFRKLREKHRFLRGLSVWMGFKQQTFLYKQDERYAGKTKYSFRKMFRFALDGITSFSRVPLQMASYLGMICSLLGGLYAVYAIAMRLFTNRTVPGWTSLMIVVTMIGGVQLLTLGVIGEYLGRVYEEVKGRPLYLINAVYENTESLKVEKHFVKT